MDGKEKEGSWLNKASPLRRNIGVGLTRGNLVTPGTRTPDAKPLKGASLTPAIKLKISGASLPTVTRANSERYQSAYSRLGGQRNTSYTELSAITPSGTTASSDTTTQIDGKDINQLYKPRRGFLSTGLKSESHGREISQIPFSSNSPLSFKTEPAKGKTVVDNDSTSQLEDSKLHTDAVKLTDKLKLKRNTETIRSVEEDSKEVKKGVDAEKGVTESGITDAKKISKFGILVSEDIRDKEKTDVSVVPRTVPRFGKEVINSEEKSDHTKDKVKQVLADAKNDTELVKPWINSGGVSGGSVTADSNTTSPEYPTPKWRSEVSGQSTPNSRSEVIKVETSRSVSINNNDTDLESISPGKVTSSEVKDVTSTPSPRSDSGYGSPRNDLDNLENSSSRSLGTERSSESKDFEALSGHFKTPSSKPGEDNQSSLNFETMQNTRANSRQGSVSSKTGERISALTDEESSLTPIARPRTRRRLTKRAVSFKKVETMEKERKFKMTLQEDDEFIGFASLPEQVHRKAVRRGFEFTLMVVGETGLGKSTLINSLFLTDLYKDKKLTNGSIEERIHKTIEIEKRELEIEERGVKLKLTIVDTPGFNDAVNAEESWKSIMNFIDKQFEQYFKAESGLNRKNIQDTRVHCCLYFISPYGHGLRPVDILVMKKLHHKVNIVPLIAKSDMLTKQEQKRLKERVLLEIEKHRIQIYQFPDCDSDEDEDFKQQDKELKKSIPFAVVGSNTVVEAGGKKIRGRMYPWGIVEVENPLHCDFIRLRQMLISTHMQDLKDVTCDVHYENYRAEHITEQMTSQQKERGKLKRDSIANLDQVVDTDKLLQEKEAEIKRMQEMLVKMQAQLTNQNSPQKNGRITNVK